MEAKEGERILIAKPVASRPSCSTFKTFTELMNDSVIASPQSNHHEIVDASIIRPKTVRFQNPASSTVLCPQEEGNVIGKSCEDSGIRNYVVYKPKAKLVSKATVSVLANMLQGNNQQTWRHTEEDISYGKSVSQGMHLACPKVSSFTESEPSIVDRSLTDGYKWRKYGQKQVKGSECPRSYYKCTHPKCPVKKKVERSLLGQVSEIVYQGEHNHLKPTCPLPRRASSSGIQKQPQGLIGQDDTTTSNNNNNNNNNVYCSLWSNQRSDLDRNKTEMMMSEDCVVTPFEFVVPRSVNSNGDNSDSGCRSSQCDEGSNGGELDEPNRSKRRKNEKQTSETGVSSQGSMESDSLEDGFKWRKYGQKVVGGNAYPRSYYRCTSANCRARKHVERASDDPRAFITTYEGKHNHNHLVLKPTLAPSLNSPTTRF